MVSLSERNVKALKSLGIALFNVDTNIMYRAFVLTSWNGTERFYRRAGDAIRHMRDDAEPYFMRGIMNDGEMVLIAAH